MKKSLVDEGLNDCDIILIQDLNRYSIWVNYVESFVPPFDTVITNNPLTKRLFKEKSYKIMEPPLYSRERFAGSEIRRRILHNESWQDLVPKAVVRMIEQIEGTERIRAIASKPVSESEEDEG